MNKLKYKDLKEASRTNVGSEIQIAAEREMIIRANKFSAGSCTGLEHAIKILDNL